MASSINHSLASTLLEKIRNFSDGNPEKLPTTGSVRHIRQKDYNELQRLLEGNPDLQRFASHRLKLTYNSRRSKLSYDMAGELHDKISSGVVDSINGQLSDIARKWKLPDINGQHQPNLAEQIEHSGTSPISYGESDKSKSPDGNWKFLGAEPVRSCFALEVANSQSYGNIRGTVLDLMEQTDGHPGLVLVISINYNAPNAKTIDKTTIFTLFQACQDEQPDGSMGGVIHQPERRKLICDSSGKAEQGSISFTLRDFLGFVNEPSYQNNMDSNDPAVAANTAKLLDEKISIAFEDVVRWIEVGEKLREKKVKPSGLFRRSVSASPPDKSDSSGSSPSSKHSDDGGLYQGNNVRIGEYNAPRTRSSGRE